MDNNQLYPHFPVPQGPPPNMPMKPMRSHRPMGLIIAVVVLTLLFISTLLFAVWAFAGRADYKSNSDKKVADAVAIAIKEEDSKKDNEFREAEKNPLKSYKGPDTYGSLEIQYPKTWSAYVEQADRSATPINGYFHPDFVPALTSGTAFALRVQVTSGAYDQELKKYDGLVKAGKVKVTAYAPKNVSGTVGSRLEGEINPNQKGVLILLPLRDKTLRISSESPQFATDFDKIILENLKFTP